MKKEILEKLKRMSRVLKEDYHADQVIVFGSYALGFENEESDIDLLVVAPTQERWLERMATVRRLIREEKRGIPNVKVPVTKVIKLFHEGFDSRLIPQVSPSQNLWCFSKKR